MASGLRGAGVTPFFKTVPMPNYRKSVEIGRPIFEDVEVVEIRFAGSKEITTQPAHMYSHWEVDEDTQLQEHLTYAERWPKQYMQFKNKQSQTKSGTPLDYVPFLSESKRLELRALAIYTVEALAEIDGQPLKNLGGGGRDLKNKAIDYLANSTHDGVIAKQQQQIDMLLAQIKSMEAEMQLQLAPPRDPEEKEEKPREDVDEEDLPEDEQGEEEDGEGVDERPVAAHSGVHVDLVGMNRDQLQAYIIAKTGKRPVGNPSTKNLVRIAQELT